MSTEEIVTSAPVEVLEAAPVVEEPKPAAKETAKTAGRKRGPNQPGNKKLVRAGNATYGRRVAVARRKAELTQGALAKKVGVTQPAICNVEKGTAPASEALQKRIARVLGL